MSPTLSAQHVLARHVPAPHHARTMRPWFRSAARRVVPRVVPGRRAILRAVATLAFAISVLGTATTVAMAQPEDPDASADKDATASDPESRGKEFAKRAMGHYKVSEFADALRLFTLAEELYPTGQVLRMTGYTLMALERWREAADKLDVALGASFRPLGDDDRSHAQKNLQEVLTHLVVVEVISEVVGAAVTVDGKDEHPTPHTFRLDPGAHTVVVSATDHDDISKKIDLGAGERTSVSLDPTPITTTPKPQPEPDKPDPIPEEPSGGFGWFPGQGPLGLSVMGVGLVGGIVGAAMGGYGTSLRNGVQDNINSHNSNYDADCSRHRDLCLTDIELINRDGQRANDFQTAGLVLGITGGALFLVGTTLFLFSDLSPLSPAEGDGQDVSDSNASRITVNCGIAGPGVLCSGDF